MNLNTLINKIHYIAFSVMVLFLSPIIAQQNLISWEVADPALNRKFIEMYLNKLIENDKFDQNSIQASDVIMVQMQQQDGKLTLKRLRAKNYDSGEYRRFMMDQVKKLGPDIMNTIMDRKYKWAEINRRDLSALETYSNIDNILNERSFKRARDGFWWTTSQVEVSTNQSIYIRSKSTNQAFRLETGISDLRNALKGTDTEMVKKKTQDLVQSSMKLGEAVYKEQQKQSGTKDKKQSADSKNNEKQNKENVVDADFEEVKEDKNDKDKEKRA